MEQGKNASQLSNGGLLTPSAPADLTAVRAKDTLYQNQTERPILLIVDTAFVQGDAVGGAVSASLALQTGEQAAAIAERVKRATSHSNQAAGVTQSSQVVITFIIPPGHFYKIVSATVGSLSTALTPHWYEVPL